MNKIQFDRLLRPLAYLYDEIELDLIKNILDSLDNYNNVQGSMKWYLEKLADLGTIDRKNIKVFKRNKAKIRQYLDTIVEIGSKSSDYLYKLEEYRNIGKLNIDLSNLYQSNSFNKVVKEALKDTYDIADLIQTKALESAREEYKNILNQAYLETSSGIYPYQESIRKALDKFARVGITTATYSNGFKIGIEAAVRRDVITRVNKLIGDIDIENTKALKTNLVYVDQHLGARTRNKHTKNDYEAHAEWQGKVYKIAEYDEELYPYGSNKDYPDFFSSTGYGEMLGLKGINCYHNFEPFFNWQKVPEQLDSKENEEKYNLLQQQRAYERKIRKLKRKKLVEANVDEKNAINEQLNSVHKEFDKFLKDNKLDRDYSREYVNNNMFKHANKDKWVDKPKLDEFVKNNNVNIVDWQSSDALLQEKYAKEIGYDSIMKIVTKNEYKNYDGIEISRVVTGKNKQDSDKIVINSKIGDIQYSNEAYSYYGKGLYYGDKKIESKLIREHGNKNSAVINCKISKNAKILEVEDILDYIKSSNNLARGLKDSKLRNFYNNPAKNRNILFMNAGIDIIKIQKENYYVVLNRGVLITNEK